MGLAVAAILIDQLVVRAAVVAGAAADLQRSRDGAGADPESGAGVGVGHRTAVPGAVRPAGGTAVGNGGQGREALRGLSTTTAKYQVPYI
jgi:hypothetical protein